MLDFLASQLVYLILFEAELLALYRVNSSYLPAILDLNYEHMPLISIAKSQQYIMYVVNKVYALNNPIP